MSAIKLKLLTLTEEICFKNFEYWMSSLITTPKNDALDQILPLSNSVLPAHTFAYRYFDTDSGNYFYPIKSIFGYNDSTKEFDPYSAKLISSSKRKITGIPNNHMSTSYKLGHDIFLFAYHGVHNPYHRYEDALPIRPFGLFLKKEAETFPYCHGSPCDVAEKNANVDRSSLRKYYLLPNHLREFKATQIVYDKTYNPDFWYNYGNPSDWIKVPNYGHRLYEKTGEFRYMENINPSNIEGILWPFDIDKVLPGNIPDIDANLDLFNSFKKAFPEISIISYNFDEEYNDNWALALVEASFYSTRYRLVHGKYPQNARLAKIELMNKKDG